MIIIIVPISIAWSCRHNDDVACGRKWISECSGVSSSSSSSPSSPSARSVAMHAGRPTGRKPDYGSELSVCCLFCAKVMFMQGPMTEALRGRPLGTPFAKEKRPFGLVTGLALLEGQVITTACHPSARQIVFSLLASIAASGCCLLVLLARAAS